MDSSSSQDIKDKNKEDTEIQEQEIDEKKEYFAKFLHSEIVEDDNDSDYTPLSFDDDSGSEISSAPEISGVEEEGVSFTTVPFGESKLYKLKFDDVEKIKVMYQNTMKDTSESEEEIGVKEKEVASQSIKNGDQGFGEPKQSCLSFSKCQSGLLNLNFSDYNSDDDDDFDPMYCGDTLSDEDYDVQELVSDSDPEIEILDEQHKKTGERLKSLKIDSEYITVDSKSAATTSSSMEQ